jgi:hypothetical protein
VAGVRGSRRAGWGAEEEGSDKSVPRPSTSIAAGVGCKRAFDSRGPDELVCVICYVSPRHQQDGDKEERIEKESGEERAVGWRIAVKWAGCIGQDETRCISGRLG